MLTVNFIFNGETTKDYRYRESFDKIWTDDDMRAFMKAFKAFSKEYREGLERNEKWLDSNMVAKQFDINRATVLEWAKNHGMPCKRSGTGGYLFNLPEVVDWVSKNRPKHMEFYIQSEKRREKK